MMSLDGISKRVHFRRMSPVCAIMAYAILSLPIALLPNGAAAQGAGDPPVLAPGLHELTLTRAGEPVIGYAISIPPTYSPATPGPLILALHFGIGDRDSAGVVVHVYEPIAIDGGVVSHFADSPGGVRHIVFRQTRCEGNGARVPLPVVVEVVVR